MNLRLITKSSWCVLKYWTFLWWIVFLCCNTFENHFLPSLMFGAFKLEKKRQKKKEEEDKNSLANSRLGLCPYRHFNQQHFTASCRNYRHWVSTDILNGNFLHFPPIRWTAGQGAELPLRTLWNRCHMIDTLFSLTRKVFFLLQSNTIYHNSRRSKPERYGDRSSVWESIVYVFANFVKC